MGSVNKLRFLLFQIRKPDDPMKAGEMECFCWALGCAPEQITAIDLIDSPPSSSQLQAADMVLIGGAGDYSVPEGGPWLESALDTMRELHAGAKPTFASCWGFQAMAAAMGGHVVADHRRAEIGTLQLQLTDAGRQDPVFASLGSPFLAHVGHHDTVDRLPADGISLVHTDKVANHAFRFAGKPIYCTQFHPELQVSDMMARLRMYPWYVKNIAGVKVEDFRTLLDHTHAANRLIRQFVRHVFGG